eukprot:353338-Chlamydomonas_euryale.AAC.1
MPHACRMSWHAACTDSTRCQGDPPLPCHYTMYTNLFSPPLVMFCRLRGWGEGRGGHCAAGAWARGHTRSAGRRTRLPGSAYAGIFLPCSSWTPTQAWSGLAHGTVWRGMAWLPCRDCTAWHGMALRGVAWRDTARHGMAWHGTAWHGTAQ